MDLVVNRKARHDYEILEVYEAGIVLQGTEIKSLRDHHGSLQEAYVKFLKGELYLVGASILPYRFGNLHNHEERRDRKLLLHHSELRKLKIGAEQKGLTIIPLRFFLKAGKAKLDIALGKGKKAHDKRQALKERDIKREINTLL